MGQTFLIPTRSPDGREVGAQLVPALQIPPTHLGGFFKAAGMPVDTPLWSATLMKWVKLNKAENDFVPARPPRAKSPFVQPLLSSRK